MIGWVPILKRRTATTGMASGVPAAGGVSFPFNQSRSDTIFLFDLVTCRRSLLAANHTPVHLRFFLISGGYCGDIA